MSTNKFDTSLMWANNIASWHGHTCTGVAINKSWLDILLHDRSCYVINLNSVKHENLNKGKTKFMNKCNCNFVFSNVKSRVSSNETEQDPKLPLY